MLELLLGLFRQFRRGAADNARFLQEMYNLANARRLRIGTDSLDYYLVCLVNISVHPMYQKCNLVEREV